MMVTRQQNYQNKIIRSCILQEILNDNSIEEAYENVSKDNAIEYTEFEFWYYRLYRFYNALDQYEDREPKYRSFSDLPIDIVGKLVEGLGPVDRLILRKVSHYLQEVVNDKAISCEFLSFACYDEKATLYLDDRQLIDFKSVDGGCEMRYNGRNHFVSEGNYLKMALNEMTLVMKQAKLRLKKLVIGFHVSSRTDKEKQFSSKYLAFIDSAFKTLNHQVHVKDAVFIIDRLESVLSILPYLQSGTLESIVLVLKNGESDQSVINKLIELNQWKEAKVFQKLDNSNFPLSIEHLFHFTQSVVNFKSISEEDLIKIRDILLSSPDIEHCCLKSTEIIEEHLFESIFGSPLLQHWPYSLMYRVPDTGKVYQICYYSYMIRITTKFIT